MLPKFCVFCGQKPKTKTNEHIIPQWLINLTGKPNRQGYFGIDFRSSEKEHKYQRRKFSFSSFKFPACENCNKEFSTFESEAKTIIQKILAQDYVNNIEINALLDWFDKIRIGVWLGSLLLDRNSAPVSPKFYIKSRIAQKDRCLLVYEIGDDFKGIQIIGSDYPLFTLTPSCFAICINNLYFFNISFDFLFSKNIGFPFPIHKEDNAFNPRTLLYLERGTQKVQFPLIRYNFIEPSIQLYQPIMATKLCDPQNTPPVFYQSEYVKGHCMDYAKGLGSIFYYESNEVLELDDETEICLSGGGPLYERRLLTKQLAKQVIRIQLKLDSLVSSGEGLPPHDKKMVKTKMDILFNVQKQLLKLLK